MLIHRATRPIVLEVSALAKASKSLVGEARGDVISELAKTNGNSDRNAVSVIAPSDATAAHTTGNKSVDHGGAVSAAAHAR